VWAMSVWAAVRQELLRLRAEQPALLMAYTDPNAEPDPSPPFFIQLDASAVTTAHDLHRRFGEQAELRVGALPFPPSPDQPWRQPALRKPVPLDHSIDGIRVELAGPLTVRSGTTSRHTLTITNDTAGGMAVQTNGQLTAQVVDPRDGSHVGGSAAFQTQPLVRIHIAPGTSAGAPLLVGTTSFVPRLGYTIPPGRWGITADLQLEDGRRLLTPILPIEVLPGMEPS